MSDRFLEEAEAYKSLTELYEHAKTCRANFEKAGTSLPEPLKRFLGMNGASAAAVNGTGGGVTPPERPKAPKEALNEWIWIDVNQALPQSVMHAILRKNNRPMRPKELGEEVNEHRPDVTSGGVYNMGPRLDGKSLQRGEDGWTLLHPEQAPILHAGNLWGPSEIFAKQELAAHRRDAILHILKFHQTGLQTLQIVEALRKCHWVKAPVNKDMVKLDMEVLSSGGRVRRRGNTKKWELAPTDN